MFDKLLLRKPQSSSDLIHAPLSDPPTVTEIQARVQRRYIDRLSQRVRRIRKLLLERDWVELRNEARQLREGGEEFGFQTLATLGAAAERAIPEAHASRLKPMPEARQAIENLVNAIDLILAEANARSN